MKIPKRLFFSLITQTFLSLVCCLSISVFAASYPDRPMKWIVPYPPGGTTDVIARNIAQNMSEQLGQPIVIENKPGAGGQIAMNYVAKAPYNRIVRAGANRYDSGLPYDYCGY